MRANIGTRIPRTGAPISANGGKPENRLRNGNVCANPYERCASSIVFARLVSYFSRRVRRTLYETAAGIATINPATVAVRVVATSNKISARKRDFEPT